MRRPGRRTCPSTSSPSASKRMPISTRRRSDHATRGGEVGRARRPLRPHHRLPGDGAVPRRDQRALPDQGGPLRAHRHGSRDPARLRRAARHLALATVLTPCLRAYIARSARRSKVSSSSSGSAIATPTLTLSGSGTPSAGAECLDRAPDALGDLDRFARALLLTAQHDELVASDARDEVASADDRANAHGRPRRGCGRRPRDRTGR